MRSQVTRRIKMTLTPPHTGLSHVVEAAKGLEPQETIKVSMAAAYTPSPLRYLAALEKAYPGQRFQHEIVLVNFEKWLYLYVDGRSTNGEQPKEVKKVRMTPSGKQVNPFDLKLTDIETEDIVHHLARICRFNGGANGHYSVAEHSIKVAGLLPDHLKLWGLLHDAGEPYLGDVRRPLRKRFADLEVVELAILETIALKYDLQWPIPEEVFWADDEILKWELDELNDGQLFGNHFQHAHMMFRKALEFHRARQPKVMKIYNSTIG